MKNNNMVTVSDLITLLDKDGNRRGGATGKERMLSVKVNGEFMDISFLQNWMVGVMGLSQTYA